MRQEDTRRLPVTMSGVLALVLAVLSLALLLWPETLRELLFSAEPRSPSGERDGWGWLALGWFALVGSWLILVAVAALLLPAVGRPPSPAATAPSRETLPKLPTTTYRQRRAAKAASRRAEGLSAGDRRS